MIKIEWLLVGFSIDFFNKFFLDETKELENMNFYSIFLISQNNLLDEMEKDRMLFFVDCCFVKSIFRWFFDLNFHKFFQKKEKEFNNWLKLTAVLIIIIVWFIFIFPIFATSYFTRHSKITPASTKWPVTPSTLSRGKIPYLALVNHFEMLRAGSL